MKTYLRFLQQNPYLLTFGILLTFFSSVGQTFLISLYIPSIEEAFNFTNTGVSSIYAAATTTSAFILPWVGRLIDTWPLRRFVFGVFAGLILACVIMSTAFHPLLIFLGFFALRFFGQALMSHTSVSTMARAFDRDRGKSISVATLGHPLGEALLPVTVALGIGYFGWQQMFLNSAIVLLVILAPSVYALLRKFPKKVLFPDDTEVKHEATTRNPFLVFKNRSFWIIAPAVFILGYLNTAIFFFQIKLGNSRGWDPEWVAVSFSAFAISSAAGMMLSGPIVDKLSARKLFPFILIPYIFGIVILAYFDHRWSYPVALILLAISNGAGSTIKNALFAEIFGTRIIGSVRSVFTTVIVFSTALGPVSFGLLLDQGITFSAIFWLFVLVLSGIVIWSQRIRYNENRTDRNRNTSSKNF